MTQNKKAADAARTHDKGTNSCAYIQQVRRLFLSGKKFSARQLNHIVGMNDSRKLISRLRHEDGWNIQDVRQADGSKLYWLMPDSVQQLSLFDGGTFYE